MKIFVTGATGWVGSAIVKDLVAARHEVLGLAHSDASAAKLEAIGVEVHRGTLDEPESLARGAAKADATIHTAFNHDFSKWKEHCENDRRVIEAMGAKTRTLIVTSATGALVNAGLRTEISGLNPHNARKATEEAANAVAERGVNVSVVRLAASVHGDGDALGFVTTLIKLARAKESSAYVEDGANRWSATHRDDAARMYRLILEKRPAGGRYHAVAEEGISLRDLATAIGKKLGVPVKSLSKDEAAAHFGSFAHFAAMDASASSAQTRTQLGWEPKGPTLFEDFENGAYFK